MRVLTNFAKIEAMEKHEKATVEYLKTKKNILFLTTSNRWEKHTTDMPKSTALAYKLAIEIGEDKVTVMDIPQLIAF